MKIITVPPKLEKITLMTMRGNVPTASDIELVFSQWLQSALDEYVPLGKGQKAQRQAKKIADLIEKANGILRFEDADFEVVEAAVKSFQYNPKINRHAGPFWDALENAQDVKA